MTKLGVFSDDWELFKQNSPGQTMKLLRCLALPTALAAIFLPSLSASAQFAEPDHPCYMRTASGRVINLTVAMCGGTASNTAVAVPANALAASKQEEESSPLKITGIKIKRSAAAGLIQITGYVVNPTNEDQKVNRIKYRLIDKQTQRTAAIDSTFVAKTIPPGGRVAFETFVDRKDVNKVPTNRMLFSVVSINE
jgi:hypothetical protein